MIKLRIATNDFHVHSVPISGFNTSTNGFLTTLAETLRTLADVGKQDDEYDQDQDRLAAMRFAREINEMVAFQREYSDHIRELQEDSKALCGFQAFGMMPKCVLLAGHGGNHTDGFGGFYGINLEESK